jgi:hypothetical protein
MEGDNGGRGIITEEPPRVQPTSRRRPLEHWLVLLTPLAGLALIAVFAFVVEPDTRGFGTHEKLGLPSCKMMDWFGVPCPGCGVTTSVALASRGRLLESIRTQPFGVVVMLGILVGTVWAIRGQIRGRNLYADLVAIPRKPWGIALGTLLGVAWIYKVALVFGAFPWSPR